MINADEMIEHYEKQVDNVNHPQHYEGSTSLECIDVMELLLGPEGLVYFCIGNAFKYMWRYKNKNGKEDIKKADWYLNKAYEVSRDMELDEGLPVVWESLTVLYEKIMSKENYYAEKPDQSEQC